MKTKLDLILESVAKLEITAYEIANSTGLSHSGIQKILNKEVAKPRESTLNLILQYIETKKVGSAIPGHVNYNQNTTIPASVSEPLHATEDPQIYKDYVQALRRNAILEGELIRLKEILDAHGIKH